MPGTIGETIDRLAARWSAAGGLLPGFRLLAEGEPLSIARLAEETGLEIDRLRETLVSVRSVDPISAEIVRLGISPEGVDFAEPASAMATMAVANARDIAANVGAAFCSHVNHFVSSENAQVFASESAVRSVLPVDDLNELGTAFYRAIRSRAA